MWTMTKRPELTPKRLSQQLIELDITNREAAYYCGVIDSTIYRWLKGDTPIPASVIRMFDLMIHVRMGEVLTRVRWHEPDDAPAASATQLAGTQQG
jgi:hypothetical protein